MRDKKLWGWFKHFVMPGGRGEERFFCDNLPKIFISPLSLTLPLSGVCVGVFLFCFFNGEVGKILSILPTLHTSLEQHHICVQHGPSYEGGSKRRWLQFLAV